MPRAGGRNPWKDFRGERSSNPIHVSTTDPEALLARKGEGQAAKDNFAGHVLILSCVDWKTENSVSNQTIVGSR